MATSLKWLYIWSRTCRLKAISSPPGRCGMTVLAALALASCVEQSMIPVGKVGTEQLSLAEPSKLTGREINPETLDAAINNMLDCHMEYATRFAPLSESADVIADAIIQACSNREVQLVAALAPSLGWYGAQKAVEDSKSERRSQVLWMVLEMRRRASLAKENQR